jgi:hypothetical protein
VHGITGKHRDLSSVIVEIVISVQEDISEVVAVPSFLLPVSIVVDLGLSITHPEAGVVSGFFACGAVLLAVNLDDSAATCDHTGDGSCREH